MLVYEEAKIRYAAILRAFADKTGIWPDPVLSAVTPSAKPQSGVANAIAGAADAVAQAVPSPGAEIAKVVSTAAQAVAGQPQQAANSALECIKRTLIDADPH